MDQSVEAGPSVHHNPLGGSLFLFDKKVQKHYRNDGYNWKKKKDGKTLSEGHRKYEVKGHGKLNCYYAYVEGKRNFLRRCYWMPERDFSHIVLVHYLEETVRLHNLSYHSFLLLLLAIFCNELTNFIQLFEVIDFLRRSYD
ncbi:hypothetical protein SLA2020_292960 [Shorea laevis]